MRWGLIVALTAAACGRIRFDPSRDGGSSGDGGPASDAQVFIAAPPCGCTTVATGAEDSCVRLETGIVRCWGDNFRGQLGDGTETDHYLPSDVLGFSDALDVAAGGGHNCARRPGAVSCWGEDQAGTLGNGSAPGGGLPTLVSGITDAIDVDASRFHSCFVRSGGTAECCGLNNYGQIADGTSANTRTTPAQVVGLTSAAGAAAGEYFSCFVRTDGRVDCAGNDDHGELGDNSFGSRSTLAPVLNLTTAVQIVAGRYHTCARVSDGRVECWGFNNVGQLGDGTMVTERGVPDFVVGLTDAVDLAAGQNHTCAVRATGAIVCWGANESGELGLGYRGSSEPIPVEVTALQGRTATDLDAGDSHTCAIVDGGLYCWGQNGNGQLGDGTMQEHLIPTPVGGF